VARLICFCSVAGLLLQSGRLLEAEPLLSQAIEASRRHKDDPAIVVRLSSVLALRAQFTGDLGGALSSFQAASQAHQLTGNERSSLVLMVNMAVTYVALGGFADAEEILSKALMSAARLGLSHIEAYVCLNLSVAQLRQGRLEALSTATLARETGAARSDPRLEGSARIVAAQIALAQRSPEVAEQEARAAIVCLQIAPPLYAESLALLSEALLAQGKAVEALGPAQEAMEILESGVGIESGESIIRLAFYEALRANQDARAARVLSQAREKLLARAEKISDKFWRDSFLDNVPVNARLLAL
jgi:eukaryotic-like serine/threonine-protein kinase